MSRYFCGERRNSEVMKKSVSLLMQHTPKWQEQKGEARSTINFCYWYFGTFAIFQSNDKAFREWSDGLLAALLESQRGANDSEDEEGSWDPIDPWGACGGRVYSTAMAVLALEVQCRFLRQRAEY
ncbi:MAG: hypothetical protein L0Z55_03355 [Planctomycetes bacterium]|nr:hypothetical protein [Planctomycetota bacterium]